MFVGFLFLVASSCDCFSVLFFLSFFHSFFEFAFFFRCFSFTFFGIWNDLLLWLFVVDIVLSFSSSFFLFYVQFLLWWILCRTETCLIILILKWQTCCFCSFIWVAFISLFSLFYFIVNFSRIFFLLTLSRSLFCRRLPFRNYNLFLYWIYLHFIIVIMNYECRCGVPYYWHIADIQFDRKTK